jgi:hypothetical protein
MKSSLRRRFPRHFFPADVAAVDDGRERSVLDLIRGCLLASSVLMTNYRAACHCHSHD